MKSSVLFVAALCAATSLVQADVKEDWTRHCAKCHGADGKGDTKMGRKSGARDYTDAKVQAELKDDKALKSIKEGIKDADGKTVKKPFGQELSDEQIKQLIGHIRTFRK